jgi:hypothetical protein
LPEEKLIYRKLPPSEWGRLKPLFQFLDAFLPDSIAATASVVENRAGSIVGFQMVQLISHAEPHWEAPEYRGHINFLRLYKLVEPKDVSKALIAPGFMVIATTPAVERMAELAGYTRLPGTCWTKDLRKKEEAA